MNRKREYVTLIGSRSIVWRAINAIRAMRSTSKGRVIVSGKESTEQECTRKCLKY